MDAYALYTHRPLLVQSFRQLRTRDLVRQAPKHFLA